jgi:hypothetical protein
MSVFAAFRAYRWHGFEIAEHGIDYINTLIKH